MCYCEIKGTVQLLNKLLKAFPLLETVKQVVLELRIVLESTGT